MPMPEPGTVVVDTNVLLNLALSSRLEILGALPEFRFVVPEEVLAEVTRPEQREMIEQACAASLLNQVKLIDLPALSIFAELRPILGLGEAACLALAETHGWSIASDEKRVFSREARRRLGEGRVFTTVDLFVVAIRRGILTVEEADGAKRLLETHRFRMTGFDSFRELL